MCEFGLPWFKRQGGKMRLASLLVFALLSINCHGEEYPYKGGMIHYDHPQGLPEAAPVCENIAEPEEWEPVNCVENSSGECCYWREQKFNSAGTKLLDCRHDWCYNKYECKWHHVISRCEGGQ